MPKVSSGVRERILVIKLGALGDFIQAIGPMQAIRRHHPGAHIVCLTTPPFADLARSSGCFDEVWIDSRPALWNVPGWLALRARLRGGNFTRVYDLQTSQRSNSYFRLLGGPIAAPAIAWSGIAPGCSHPHADPRRNALHTVDRQAAQLKIAGIAAVPPADLSFLKADVARFALPKPYALLVPGGAAHRPKKRWPSSSYRALALELAANGIASAVLGAASERGLAREIASSNPAVRDLTGNTSLAELASLARDAAAAVGNDTGPMHIIAGTGCPSAVLFSAASDPALCAPRGPAVVVLQRPDLSELSPGDVMAALNHLGIWGRRA